MAAANLIIANFDGNIQSMAISIFSFPFKGDATHYLVMLIIGILLLLYSLTKDYAGIFPDKLTFAVYFDDAGISKILEQSDESTLENIDVCQDWAANSVKFQSKLLQEVNTRLNMEVNLDAIDQISAKGITTFVVSKDSRSFQRYTMSEIDGYLDFDLPLKETSLSMKSFFQLRNSPRDHFNITLKEMLVDWKFPLSPMMKQTYLTGPGNEIILENVIALTWVKIFPFVDIGNTLYLAKDGNEYVPLCYCSYRQ